MPSKQIEADLAERLWERVRPLLPEEAPKPEGGRPRADDRLCFLGIVHVLRSGCRWRDVPGEYPCGTTCWRRHKEWAELGVWRRAWDAVLEELAEAGELPADELAIDATFVGAKKGGKESANRCPAGA